MLQNKKVDAVFVICSHEEIDVSHPDFFASAKLNGYVPPNKEVINTKSCTFYALDIEKQSGFSKPLSFHGYSLHKPVISLLFLSLHLHCGLSF